MANPTTTSAARPILWVTMIALLLVALTSRVTVRTCIGACSEVTTHACCASEAQPADDGCCGCCEPSGSHDGGIAAGDDDGSDDDGDAGSDCDGGCCVTIAFDVEMAPNVDVAKLSPMPAVICWIDPLPQPVVRVIEAARPFCFDRGPPRIDRTTALRATQVLLI